MLKHLFLTNQILSIVFIALISIGGVMSSKPMVTWGLFLFVVSLLATAVLAHSQE